MSQSHAAAELERQELIKQCHCLIAAIASRPGSTKLLRGVLPMLEVFAAYKQKRARSPSQRKPRHASFDKAELRKNI
jgi:hypothetical protein